MPQLLLERPREGFDLFCLELCYWRRLRLGPSDRGIELGFLSAKILDAGREALIDAEVAGFGKPIEVADRGLDLGPFGSQGDQASVDIACKGGAAGDQLFQKDMNALGRQDAIFHRFE